MDFLKERLRRILQIYWIIELGCKIEFFRACTGVTLSLSYYVVNNTNYEF